MNEEQCRQRDEALGRLFQSLWMVLLQLDCPLDHAVALFTAAAKKASKEHGSSNAVATPIADSDMTLLLADILAGWHDNIAYVDKSGNPIALKKTGDVPSFETLYEKAAEGNGAGRRKLSIDAALEWLIRARTVEIDEGGHYRPLRYGFPTNAQGHAGTLRNLDHLTNIAGTIANNSTPNRRVLTLNVASGKSFDSDYLPMLLQILDDQGMNLLREINDFIAKNRTQNEKKAMDIFVGMYLAAKDPFSVAALAPPPNIKGIPGREGSDTLRVVDRD